jgi:hypothetical protein
MTILTGGPKVWQSDVESPAGERRGNTLAKTDKGNLFGKWGERIGRKTGSVLLSLPAGKANGDL